MEMANFNTVLRCAALCSIVPSLTGTQMFMPQTGDQVRPCCARCALAPSAQQLAQGVACCMASGALPLTPGKRVQGPAGLDSAPSAQRAVLAATR